MQNTMRLLCGMPQGDAATRMKITCESMIAAWNAAAVSATKAVYDKASLPPAYVCSSLHALNP